MKTAAKLLILGLVSLIGMNPSAAFSRGIKGSFPVLCFGDPHAAKAGGVFLVKSPVSDLADEVENPPMLEHFRVVIWIEQLQFIVEKSIPFGREHHSKFVDAVSNLLSFHPRGDIIDFARVFEILPPKVHIESRAMSDIPYFRRPYYVGRYPSPLGDLRLFLYRLNAILRRVGLLLGKCQLLACRNAGLSRISSRFMGGDGQEIGLRSHFPKLSPEYKGGYAQNNQGSNCNVQRSSCIPKGITLKNSKLVILDHPCEQGIVDYSYWKWFSIFCLAAAGLSAGRLSCDVLLNDGRWGQGFERLICRGSLTERERLLVALLWLLVTVSLFLQAFIIVTRKYLTHSDLCNTVISMANVPVKEVFQGKTVWEGVVEVFDLVGHPTAFRAYAWAHDTDDPANPRRHVTVLHTHPIKSAQDAVRAAIVQEFRSLEPAE